MVENQGFKPRKSLLILHNKALARKYSLPVKMIKQVLVSQGAWRLEYEARRVRQ